LGRLGSDEKEAKGKYGSSEERGFAEPDAGGQDGLRKTRGSRSL